MSVEEEVGDQLGTRSTAYAERSVTPARARTSSSMKKLPVHSRACRVRIQCAASARIAGLRLCFSIGSPPIIAIAAVAIAVRGQSALNATPVAELLGHAQDAHPHAVLGHGVGDVALEPPRPHVERRRQVEHVRVGGLAQVGQAGPRAEVGAAHVDAVHQVEALHRRVERPVREIAEALLTRTSMPPKVSTVFATAASTCSSARMSQTSGSARPPACSISRGRGVDRPGQLRVRPVGLGRDRDVGPVAPRRARRSPARSRAKPR